MSRNFELVQQAGWDSNSAAMPRPRPVLANTDEKVRINAARRDWDQSTQEETLRLVQRIFLQPTQTAPRVVLFAGIDQANGCSQVCLTVAEALKSTVDGSVCIVEGNFRSPSLAGLLGTTNHYGLTDALLKEGPIRSFARPLQPDNFWILSCGSLTPDSPNLLNSDRIAARFDELRKEFDFVLVDAPSLARCGDATTLGRLTDGLVLVLDSISTRKEVALKVIENLRAAQIEVLGAVVN